MHTKCFNRIKWIFLSGLTLISLLGYANPLSTNHIFDFSQNIKNAWTITGILHNEQDDDYGFMFIIERDHQLYHAYAGIFNLDDSSMVWHHEEMRSVDSPHLPENIGRFFWHFSPVNNSLIIGCQDIDDKKQILNLKIDMIEPTVISKKISLTPGLKLAQYWTGAINGHLHFEQEQFVMSSGAWMQNIWQNADDLKQHPFSQILCKFQDSTAMYAIQVPEKRALKAAQAGLYNANGQRLPISQFIDLQQPKDLAFDLKLNQNKQTLKL